MRPESCALLWHAAQACTAFSRLTSGMARNSNVANKMVRAAAERQFEVVGEALAQLSKPDPSTAKRVADHRQIVALHNVSIHGYALMEKPSRWDGVGHRVQPLKQALRRLLSKPDIERSAQQ